MGLPAGTSGRAARRRDLRERRRRGRRGQRCGAARGRHGAALVGRLAARLRAELGPTTSLALERAKGFARERGFRSAHLDPPGSPVADRVEDLASASTLKLLVRAPGSGTRLADGAARAARGLAEASSSGAPGLVEIAGPGVTKAAALAAWAAARDIDAAQVWAVGDAPNDLPMLTWAGASFAVANAAPAVLAAAGTQLPSNADDGVAHLLELAVRAAAGQP